MIRLTERKDNTVKYPKLKQGVISWRAISKLRAYEDAEEEGTLVRLPCKVGDTVYDINLSDEVVPLVIGRITVYANDETIVYTEYDHEYYLRQFGVSVFTTREAAVAAKGE